MQLGLFFSLSYQRKSQAFANGDLFCLRNKAKFGNINIQEVTRDHQLIPCGLSSMDKAM